jgi:hypothetical protein
MENVVIERNEHEVVSEDQAAEVALRELSAMELALIGGGTVSGTYL